MWHIANTALQGIGLWQAKPLLHPRLEVFRPAVDLEWVTTLQKAPVALFDNLSKLRIRHAGLIKVMILRWISNKIKELWLSFRVEDVLVVVPSDHVHAA